MLPYERHRMTFYSDDARVPPALGTDAFVRRPLRAADVYGGDAAMMTSQEALRQGNGEE
jgi:hypothetical protein